MANELVIHYPTGATLYAMLFDATGQVWNGAAFAVPGSASWTDYDIAMTEAATATGIYRASMPAAAAGAYGWVVRKQAGGSPAVGDITVGSGSIRWTGTAEEAVPAAVNVTYLAGTALTETGAGYLAAAFKKFFNVATPVFTMASVNQTGNAYFAAEKLDLMTEILGIGQAGFKTDAVYKITGTQGDTLKTLSDQIDALPTDQDVRDAMKLAPTAGAPAAGSIDKHLDDILEDTGTTLDTLIKDIPTNAELATALAGADDAVLAAIADVPTVAEFEARTLPSADYTVVSDLGTVQTGDSFARLGAPAGASVSADIAAVKSDTAAVLEDTGTTLDTLIKDVPTNAELATALAGADDAVLAAVADVPTVAEFEARTLAAASYATAAALAVVDGIVDDILVDTGTTLPASLTLIDSYLDTEVAAIKAKTDNLPASPAAVGSAMTLTAAYDAAKTAATQASVDDLPTNAELATALAGADDAVLAAVADVPTVAEFEARTLPSADYTVVSDLGTVQTGDSFARLGAPAGASVSADIAALPTDADVQTAAAAALTAYDPPTKGELDTAVAALATAAALATVDGIVDSILEDTDELQLDWTNGGRLDLLLDAASASPPSAATVADAVWDEAMAGHVAAGSTGKALADILVDTDTTLPALISAISQTVNSTTDSTAAGAITRRRGDSWSIPLTLGAITGWTSLWFTVKNSYNDLDSAALLHVKLNATGLLDGLLYVNGVSATNDALASITVSNAGTGACIVAVDETITDDLSPGTYYYDAQALIAGNVTTPDSGTFTITSDVTRSVA